MADLKIKAGDLEPITFTVTVDSQSELSVSDVTSMALYAREQSASTNHVDGATVSVDSVSTTDNGDGTWTNDFSVTFDPENNGPGGADAFSTGDEGQYKVYVLVTYTDNDTTRHPGDGFRHWHIEENLE